MTDRYEKSEVMLRHRILSESNQVSTLWQLLRHLEEGLREERRMLVDTLYKRSGSFKYLELAKQSDDIEHYLLKSTCI